MYRVALTDTQREELRRRAHDPKVKPRTRDRLEMVRLSDARFSVPQIARHLHLGEATVRSWIQAFLTGGFDALPDQPHPGQHSSLTPQIRDAVRNQIDLAQRTWTRAQLADWIAQRYGVRVTPSHLARFLRRWKLSYKRTGRSVKHKQKPEQVEAKKEELKELEKKGSRA